MIVAVIFLTNSSSEHQGGHRSLNRKHLVGYGPKLAHKDTEGHHNPEFDHIAFDPKGAHASGELEADPYYDADWMDDSIGLDDYGGYGFNISERLHELFPLIDGNSDGKVTKVEMEVWHFQVGKNSSIMRANNEFNASDVDEDGYVTLKEYLADDFELLEKLDSGKELNEDEPDFYNMDWARSSRAGFKIADVNDDGKLDHAEFYNFLHPEESGNEKMYQHLIFEVVRDRDDDKDGKLNFNEFKENLWFELKPDHDMIDDYRQDGYEHNPEHEEEDITAAKGKFTELDTDKDGHISTVELRPSLRDFHPGEEDFAKRQAVHMIEQADEDSDGHLTLAEMLQNPYVFYSAVGDEDHDGYYHDEFR